MFGNNNKNIRPKPKVNHSRRVVFFSTFIEFVRIIEKQFAKPLFLLRGTLLPVSDNAIASNAWSNAIYGIKLTSVELERIDTSDDL